jgi:EAL domain-containing protein (putative c-di-GMP-specific phosphodiesterase class I)
VEDRRDLKRALARADLILHYQPIVEPRSGKVVSAEALLRGKQDDRREWDIVHVTTEAERGTDIFELERWVIEQACQDAAEWQRHGLENLALNINLSAREFQNEEFLPTLDAAVSASGIDPAQLNLEFTETASIHQPSIAEKVMDRLRERGFPVWLDDFGTGHSSLAWLKWFPVDGLKIPGLFVRDVVDDRRCRIIVTGLIDVARRLDVTVVAEGVENQRQLDFLLEGGIDLIQGFFLYRPLPVAELRRTLSELRRVS